MVIGLDLGGGIADGGVGHIRVRRLDPLFRSLHPQRQGGPLDTPAAGQTRGYDNFYQPSVTSHRASMLRYRLSDTDCLMLGVRRRLSDVRYRVSDVDHQTLTIDCQVVDH
ncbi:hypothetical protein Taro_054365 [Colocasia esculenta]|uniref:Uncharacterized protein n=1 Tax=Colocasia esculenta TaxID=4460 RepID=A0A843XPU7_COLES|nr:hypothetical protein [Colocasia esculenta]